MIELVDAAIGAAGASVVAAKVTVVAGRWTGAEPDETDRIVDDAGDTWPLDRRFVPGPMERGAFSDGAAGPFRVTVERLAGQQPPDLAGRIRALIQEYAGRWADSARLPESRHLRVEACMHAMRWLWHTLRRLETEGAFPEDRITELRKYTSDDIVAKTMRGLADELEAIVRESAPTEET